MISYYKIPAHVEERCVSVYVCMCACVYDWLTHESAFRYRRSYIEDTILGPRWNTVLPGARLH